MPRFAANLSFLFQEFDFPSRFQAAAQAGFQGVEYLFPYEWPVEQLASLLVEANLQQVLFNLPPGDWAAGDRGIACHPGQQTNFRRGLEQALYYAEKLECRRLHAMAGLRLHGVTDEAHQAVFMENIAFAAEQCASAGVSLLIEPINSVIDMPGYWLNSPQMAFRIHQEINHPGLKVQLDLYHAQVVGCNLTALINQHLAAVGHIQIADSPGRHEPGSGDIDFIPLFSRLDELGYSEWVGCEYRPATDTKTSLHWFRSLSGNA